jgi:hypothetical protein
MADKPFLEGEKFGQNVGMSSWNGTQKVVPGGTGERPESKSWPC